MPGHRRTKFLPCRPFSFWSPSSAYKPGTRGVSLFLVLLLVQTGAPPDADARRKKHGHKIVKIREINVETKNVFDPSRPGENKWPFTWANALHIRTRHSVVARELLFRPGDRVQEELLEESERNLRALGFIKDADVTTQPAPDDQVDVNVTTQDVWTTQPQINFGSEGGQSTFSAGILEENLFGFGKTLSLFYRKNRDGAGNEYAYVDPQLLGSRWRLDSLFIKGTGGDVQRLAVNRPFYSQATKYAGGISAERTAGPRKTYENGNVINEYRQETYAVDPYMGKLLNDDVLHIHRLFLRYKYSKTLNESESQTVPGTLPINRTFSGPLVQWSYNESEFIKETFIDRVERIEDVNLGHETTASLGLYTRQLGATDNSTPFAIGDNFGWGQEGPAFGLISYGISGRYNHRNHASINAGKPEDTLYYSAFNYYRHLHEELPFTGVLHLETAYQQNPDSENPLELGGDRGLRGYKSRAFTGNKSVLGNIEGRFFYPYELLHLFYIGAAGFVDAGQVQPQGSGFNQRDIHADVGLGLRIGLTRSSGGSVYRLDVAYALGPVDGKRIVVSITSGQGFKRVGNSFGTTTSAGTTSSQ